MGNDLPTKQRRGRPFEDHYDRKRIKLGLIVSAATKKRLVVLAQQSGLTQSQEVERLIEKALLFEDLIAARLMSQQSS